MNIDGVTVLAQRAIVTKGTTGAILVAVAIILSFVSFGIAAMANKNNRAWGIFGVACLVMFLVVASLGALGVFNKDTGLYEYKCIIEDDASIHEIYDSYEVVAKEGLIWTLIDREVD